MKIIDYCMMFLGHHFILYAVRYRFILYNVHHCYAGFKKTLSSRSIRV